MFVPGIDDDESDDAGEEEFHFPRADEDEAWFPHGSQTVICMNLVYLAADTHS
jgi:hypothetical protein